MGGLVVVSVVVAYAGAKVADLHATVQELIERRATPSMQTITQLVTRSDGTQATISTQRVKNDDGTWEPVDVWLGRHNEAVQAFQNS